MVNAMHCGHSGPQVLERIFKQIRIWMKGWAFLAHTLYRTAYKCESKLDIKYIVMKLQEDKVKDIKQKENVKMKL